MTITETKIWFVEIFVIDCTLISQNDNFRCKQCWRFRQKEHQRLYHWSLGMYKLVFFSTHYIHAGIIVCTNVDSFYSMLESWKCPSLLVWVLSVVQLLKSNPCHMRSFDFKFIIIMLSFIVNIIRLLTVHYYDTMSRLIDVMRRRYYCFAPSQWETPLLYDHVSHWLGASVESALYITIR